MKSVEADVFLEGDSDSLMRGNNDVKLCRLHFNGKASERDLAIQDKAGEYSRFFTLSESQDDEEIKSQKTISVKTAKKLTIARLVTLADGKFVTDTFTFTKGPKKTLYVQSFHVTNSIEVLGSTDEEREERRKQGLEEVAEFERQTSAQKVGDVVDGEVMTAEKLKKAKREIERFRHMYETGIIMKKGADCTFPL